MLKNLLNFNRNFPLFLGISFIFLYTIPLLFLQGDFYVGTYWDFLDSNMIWFKIINDNNAYFVPNHNVYDGYMTLYRISLGTDFNIFLWLDKFFGGYNAIILNYFLMYIVAFCGMYKLIDRYVFLGKYRWINAVISISFALLPHWQPGGISVAGLPFLVYIFLNLKNGSRFKTSYFVYLIIFCLSAAFFVFSFFYILIFGILFLTDSLVRKQINRKVFIFLAVFLGLSIMVEWRLFYEMFLDRSVVYHREEFFKMRSLRDAYLFGKNSFINGHQRHVPTFHKYIILPLVLVSILLFFGVKNQLKKWVYIIFFGLIIIATFHGFWNWENLVKIKEEIPMLNAFNLDRFYVLYPFLWYSLLVLCVGILLFHFEKNRIINYILSGIVLINCLVVMYHNPLFIGYKDALKDNRTIFTYNEYYAAPVFQKMKKDMRNISPQDKVISLGISPAVANYNGLKTIDGYSAFYTLQYKHQFRKIIAPELAQQQNIKLFFDSWGSKCYIMDNVAQLDFENFEKNKSTDALDLDYAQLKAMDGKYLVSTYKILHLGKNLKYINTYEDKLRIYYLYEIQST